VETWGAFSCAGGRLCRRPQGRQPAAGDTTERIAWKLVNMADGDVNTVAMVAVYKFLDGPNWSGVLNGVLNEYEEENTTAVVRTVAAGHGLCEPPVRVEGYGEFVVPRYPEEVFKEHFRLHRSTFQVCLQYFCYAHLANLYQCPGALRKIQFVRIWPILRCTTAYRTGLEKRNKLYDYGKH